MQHGTFEITDLRQALGTFLTGVTIVTMLDAEERPLGFTANSFTSVSLEPPLVLVCLSKGSCNFTQYLETPKFAINILAEHQRELSTTFASASPDRFFNVDWRLSSGGSPILEQVAAWFDCSTHEIIDAGDHIILIGQVKAYAHSPAAPLGYLRGNYVQFELEHSAAEALENTQRNTCVGAIIESGRKLFLLSEEDGTLKLPCSSHLKHAPDQDDLHDRLTSLGLDAEALYLFAVFDDPERERTNIFYRGELTTERQTVAGAFYAFDEIPFESINDEATRSMLRRYLNERALNAFGIYVGAGHSDVIKVLNRP